MVTKFHEYKYERPDLQQISKEVSELIEKFNAADSAKAQSRVVDELNKIFNHLDTMETLANIRASIDTKDEFYDTERNFFDEYGPVITEINNKYYDAILNSDFRFELEDLYGRQLFALAENELKSYDSSIKELVQEENRLSTRYSKLLASAEIEFDGKVLNLSEFGPYMQDPDRSTRKEATLAIQGFMGDNLDEIDDIYDRLVKTRDKIAKTLGYEDFVELGYVRMNRIDYDRDMVEKFRNQVAEYVVPLVTKLKERQRRRIGLTELKSYDESFDFLTGNATPKGDTEDIMDNGAKMYKELSSETDEFYTFMTERELFDVEAKKGKEGGGYCTFIPEYNSPFIFSNFNGTLDDVTVLTHEAGHAFQTYMSRFDVPEYQFPTLESAEIHSMSMEYFTYPWMDLFFEEDTDKFKFSHMADNISFLPYGVAIDEFQHIVYENPEMTPAERRNEWKKLEEKYLPHRDYDGIEPLVDGSFWHRQIHVFGDPFYYIDYTLAQVCALQFWKRANEDFEAAWKDYVALCKLGGSLPFNALVSMAGLRSPFEEGSLKEVIEEAGRYLDAIDDTKL
ncbi:M3 family oligoendopeptidase [Salinicoccus halitifaciens]|uniref:M3 family oligoendopeptidase n=1 Tax=Salinicoccus halitifaciens TaxID=1073415 RepID=A0ABV2EC68_9STAP|nr:M3 family oligoendopeptidase [Salinicoccus halitifaciens]MCD2137330.1 M3 family oligoendopeptidase [Salinicoccus halitifaciens]